MKKNLNILGVTVSGQLKHTLKNNTTNQWQSFFGDIEVEANRITNLGDKGEYVNAYIFDTCILAITKNGKVHSAYYDNDTTDRSPNGWKIKVFNESDLKNNYAVVSHSFFSSGKEFVYLIGSNTTSKGVLEIYSIYNIWHMASLAVPNPLRLSYTLQNIPELTDIDSCVMKDISYIVATSLLGEVYIFKHTQYGSLSVNLSSDSLVYKMPNNEKALKVSCTSISDKLHIVVATDKGNLYHIIHIAQKNWGSIKEKCSNAGFFIDVSCTEMNGNLDVVGITSDGKILHTFRKDNGVWQNFFGDIESKSGEAGDFVAVTIS